MSKHTNLEYLKTSSNDPGFVKKMIELFLETLPPVMDSINEAIEQNRLDLLGKSAHKAKSSVLIVGLEKLSGLFREMELEAKAGNTEINYREIFETCRTIFDDSVIELKDELTRL